MKNALERIRELHQASTDYPGVVPLIGAVLELEERLRNLEQTKQDKSQFEQNEPSEGELSRGNLNKLFQTVLVSATERAQIVRLYKTLVSLQ